MIILDDKLFELLEACDGINQSEKWHPEGDVLLHSLQVLYQGFKENCDVDLLLAAMLHDIGKVKNSLGHEDIGADMLVGFVSEKTLWLIRNHMRIWYLLLGDMKRIKKVEELINHPWLPELLYLIRWDKMGRNPNKTIKYDKQDIMNRFERTTEKYFDDNVVFKKERNNERNKSGI